MNIYKIYFNHITEAINSFRSDYDYTFDIKKILSKLTLEPPKNALNGDMSTNIAMLLTSEIKLNPNEIANIFKSYIFVSINVIFYLER